MRSRDTRFPLTLLGCALGSALLYVSLGTLSAFLAADDFAWLGTARVEDWKAWFIPMGRTHFYRPVVEAWFAALTPVCGYSAHCYHAFSVAVHTANVLLFGALVKRLGATSLCALTTIAIFVVLPGYVEAVVWVSASTMLLAAFFWLAAAHVGISAAERSSAILWIVGAALAGLAMFSHESAASVFLVLPVLFYRIRTFDMRELVSPRVLAPFGAVVGAFALSAFVVNRRNYVFTEGHYRAGSHMIRHGLDYIAGLYVGPHRWFGPVVTFALAVPALLVGSPLTRVGAWWMFATLIPYVGFTWGNVSRYLYLPAMGFALFLGALLLTIGERAELAWPRWTRTIRHVRAAIVVLVVVRFGVFTKKAVHERREWMEVYRHYSTVVLATAQSAPGTDMVVVAPPTDPRVEAPYASSVVRWTLQRPSMNVAFSRTPADGSHMPAKHQP